MLTKGYKKVKRYTIMIGMNDSKTHEQEIETERIIRLANNCCKNYGLNFSSIIQSGGCIQEDGRYVIENSLGLVFIDADENTVNELAKDVCCFLNQESVLVTVDEVIRYFVSGRNDDN